MLVEAVAIDRAARCPDCNHRYDDWSDDVAVPYEAVTIVCFACRELEQAATDHARDGSPRPGLKIRLAPTDGGPEPMNGIS